MSSPYDGRMSLPRAPDRPTLKDRLEGCLKLGAVGDALGYLVEFDNADQIMRRYGLRGCGFSTRWPRQIPRSATTPR